MAMNHTDDLLFTHTAAHLAPLFPSGSHLVVGLSGGVDSVVLLHILHRLAPRMGWRLSALHVHHGISAHADDWAAFCQALCASHDVPLQVERVSIAGLREEHGIEAAARKLRHAALARQDCDVVVLAHHADDQAETLLLQLLRGAGVKGAAAMPLFKPATPGAPALVRPLLGARRQDLLDYARTHALRWVEDESNADDSYPRNFLRHRLLPLLERRFPAYRTTLGRSAQHFAETAALLDDLARLDALQVQQEDSLEVYALCRLPPRRARNLLRHFIHQQGFSLPDSRRLTEILRQLQQAPTDRQVCIVWAEAHLRSWRGRVYLTRGMEAAPYDVPWHGEMALQLPHGAGSLHFNKAMGQGISLRKLLERPVAVRSREGGEHMCLQPGGGRHSLKKLFQQHAVPPWTRHIQPLLYCGEELAWVSGVGYAAGFTALADEEGMTIAWRDSAGVSE